MLDRLFDFDAKIKEINDCGMADINAVIAEIFDPDKAAYSYVGKSNTGLNVK